MSTTQNYLIPSVRQGLAAAIDKPAEKNRAEIGLTLAASARNKETGAPDPINPEKKQVQLYGPGDVLGFDPRIVTRTDPKPNVGDFEPNYFPSIEFSDSDFAWRLTADVATGGNEQEVPKLMPWITLLVLRSEKDGDAPKEFDEGDSVEKNLPRYIKVNTSVLPDLEQAWRWAHVHTTAEGGLAPDELKTILRDEPECAVCRLLCARRLRPSTRYSAFVVPTFKLGVLAGRGLPLDPEISALELAWSKNGDDASLDLEIPYYYRWDFATSIRGDFEHLVRLLEKRKLSNLGTRAIDCAQPGFGTRGVIRLEVELPEKNYLDMEGALQSLDTHYTGWGNDPGIDITQTDSIYNVDLKVLSPGTSLEISCQTSKQTSAQIEYGESDTYGNTVETSNSNYKHKFILSNLNPGGTYHFRILALSEDGESFETGDGIFQLPRIWIFQQELDILINDDQPILLTAFETDDIHKISAFVLPSGTEQTEIMIRWRTSSSVPSKIEYKEGDATGGYKSVESPQLVTEHALTLTELLRDKQYLFKIVAETQAGIVETPDCVLKVSSISSIVPPIYGRWHYGRYKESVNSEGIETKKVVDTNNQNAWIDVLNLDPRHRAAAGLGAEVVRKQQEALMASAWEQLAAIESANDLLGRAQFGRETSLVLHQRLKDLPTESFLRITQPIHKRVITKHSEAKETIAHYLQKQSRIPAAALDTAFRHLSRGRGPMRKRQPFPQRGDILERLAFGDLEAAGPPPKNYTGITHICDVTKLMADSLPSLSFEANPQSVPPGGYIELSWITENVVSCTASGDWSGAKSLEGSERIGPIRETSTFILTCKSSVATFSRSVIIHLLDLPPHEPPDDGTVETVSDRWSVSDLIGTFEPPLPYHSQIPSQGEDSKLRFCEKHIDCNLLSNVTKNHKPFKLFPKDFFEIPKDKVAQQFLKNFPKHPDQYEDTICKAIDKWLNTKDAGDQSPKPPENAKDFLKLIRDELLQEIDPQKTVLARTRQRLRLRGKLALRFEEDEPKGDPLDVILLAPIFPQPMYEPLRDISHDLLLPGVEKIPQNSVGLLKTNRRFLESYLCGLNHEFAGELLWRGYPTDQRGSYFRQLWDVSEYVPKKTEIDGLRDQWLQGRDIKRNVPFYEKARILRTQLDLSNLTDDQKSLIKRFQDERIKEISQIPHEERDSLIERLDKLLLYLVPRNLLKEKLKDIKPLTLWGDRSLGSNQNTLGEYLVLVIRGDLLKRYPNTLVYAIDAVKTAKGLVPGLSEYVYSDSDVKDRRFPVFQATLPPDLTFFGFPFESDEARGSDVDPGKFFVLEEQVVETRFGLDESASEEVITWRNLSWTNFDSGLEESDPLFHSPYLDQMHPITELPADRDWINSSSAVRAWITLQKPIRVSIHAKQMIP